MTLARYSANSWIRAHQTSPDEVARLLAICDRDLEQSQVVGLGPEWRFDIAYNAVLQAATAALAAAGYRAERQNKHMRTIETLEFTVGLDATTVGFLDSCRRKRHTAVYDQVGSISDGEAEEMVATAGELVQRLRYWLATNHPDLAERG